MRGQDGSAVSIPLEADWLGPQDPGELVQALKSLITELIGWGIEPLEGEVPEAPTSR